MDRYTRQTIQKLGITPKSDTELHDAVAGFEQKWESKARRILYGDDVPHRF